MELINYDDIFDDNLASLAGMTDLRCLELDSNNITDQGLVHLSGLKSLQDLHICSENVTDAGLLHLTQLLLRKFSIYAARITDAGLDRLHCLSQLEQLEFMFLNHITEQGVERLVAACNNLKSAQVMKCTLISQEYEKSLVGRFL